MRYSQADIDLALRRAESELRRVVKGHEREKRRNERISSKSRQSRRPAPQPVAVPPARKVMPEPPPIKKAVSPPSVPEKSHEVISDTPAQSPPPAPPPSHKESPMGQKSSPPVAGAGVPEETQNESSAEPEEVASISKGVEKDAVKSCIQCRANSVQPECYCFGRPDGTLNPWGCRLSGLNWSADADWFKLGSFRDEATYIFDKKAIAEKLSQGLSEVVDCPHFNAEYAELAFEALPKRVTIGERWDYHLAKAHQENAVAIKTTAYVHGCPVHKTVMTDGVCPLGNRDALKIIRKASRKSGINQEVYKLLNKEK